MVLCQLDRVHASQPYSGSCHNDGVHQSEFLRCHCNISLVPSDWFSNLVSVPVAMASLSFISEIEQLSLVILAFTKVAVKDSHLPSKSFTFNLNRLLSFVGAHQLKIWLFSVEADLSCRIFI